MDVVLCYSPDRLAGKFRAVGMLADLARTDEGGEEVPSSPRAG